VPTYVYRFLDCDGTIEVQQAFTDSALIEAVNPADGRVHPVKKVFTPVGVSFKGGGFYKTDSRSKSSKSADTSAPKSTDGATKSTDGAATTNTPSTPAPSTSSSSSDGAKSSPPAATHSHGEHSH